MYRYSNKLCGDYCLKQNLLITTGGVEKRVDTVGNSEEEDESSFVGGSEEEETDLRVQQEVGAIVKAEYLALRNGS